MGGDRIEIGQIHQNGQTVDSIARKRPFLFHVQIFFGISDHGMFCVRPIPHLPFLTEHAQPVSFLGIEKIQKFDQLFDIFRRLGNHRDEEAVAGQILNDRILSRFVSQNERNVFHAVVVRLDVTVIIILRRHGSDEGFPAGNDSADAVRRRGQIGLTDISFAIERIEIIQHFRVLRRRHDILILSLRVLVGSAEILGKIDCGNIARPRELIEQHSRKGVHFSRSAARKLLGYLFHRV